MSNGAAPASGFARAPAWNPNIFCTSSMVTIDTRFAAELLECSPIASRQGGYCRITNAKKTDPVRVEARNYLAMLTLNDQI